MSFSTRKTIRTSICANILLCLLLLGICLACLPMTAFAATYDEHNIMTLENAGDYICTISGRKYTKVNAGKVIVGYFQSDGGYTGPMLVGETAESVAFTTTWSSRVLEYEGTLEFQGKTYYYSSREYFMPGMQKIQDEHPLYHIGNGAKMTPEAAALELLNKFSLICAGQFTEHQSVKKTVLTPASCTEPGTATAICETCGKDLGIVRLDPAHTYGEYVIDAPATCTKAGSQHRDCSVCGHKDVAEIPVLPHNYGDWFVLSGSKLIPPIVSEHRCVDCNHAETVSNWGYVWVPIVAAVGVVVVIIGIIGYAKAFKKKP